MFVFALQSPDGKYLASGAIDGIINIFDIATGKLLHTLEGIHPFTIHSFYSLDIYELRYLRNKTNAHSLHTQQWSSRSLQPAVTVAPSSWMTRLSLSLLRSCHAHQISHLLPGLPAARHRLRWRIHQDLRRVSVPDPQCIALRAASQRYVIFKSVSRSFLLKIDLCTGISVIILLWEIFKISLLYDCLSMSYLLRCLWNGIPAKKSTLNGVF